MIMVDPKIYFGKVKKSLQLEKKFSNFSVL